MAITVIHAGLLQKMLIAGARQIDKEKDYINELNVFPVPDGDTGSNMSMTIMAAAKELGNLSEKDLTIENVCKTLSSGSLKGARGNSGVILSQLFRGFTREIMDKDQLGTKEIAKAFNKAVDTAYKAVMKPKEGTILTVASAIAKKAEEIASFEQSFEVFGEKVITAGNETLNKTPKMLPVLKEAGVVDSGGKGLMIILEGAFACLSGKDSNPQITFSDNSSKTMPKPETEKSENLTDIKFKYCTEFIIEGEKEFSPKEETELKKYLSSIGDSLVVVSEGNIIKIHVHTNHPGLAFEKALTFGMLSHMKIDNMWLEQQEKRRLQQSEKEAVQITKDTGFLAVCAGDGMKDIFKGLGVDVVVNGGQTMNPSTNELIDAINEVPAKTVFVLPNNKNVILAANQSAQLSEDKDIKVISTKTMPEGITAILNFSPEQSTEANFKEMSKAINNVHSGEITYAVRDTKINNIEIKKDNIMGIADDNICCSENNILDAILKVAEALMFDDAELISIYFGIDVSKEDAMVVQNSLEDKYPDLDVELEYGGQPVYYYILSVE